MKTKRQIEAMVERVESALSPSSERMCLIMALEWALNGPISTSIGLDDWITEQNADEVSA